MLLIMLLKYPNITIMQKECGQCPCIPEHDDDKIIHHEKNLHNLCAETNLYVQIKDCVTQEVDIDDLQKQKCKS